MFKLNKITEVVYLVDSLLGTVTITQLNKYALYCKDLALRYTE